MSTPVRTIGVVRALGVVVALVASAAVAAAGPAQTTTSNVYWWWDPGQPVGTSTLVRNDSGVTATFHTSGLPKGQAVTLWFIFFNRPEECDSEPCADLDAALNELLADLFDPDVEADFHFGSGHVVGGSGFATFGAHLSVDDLDGSGKVEVGAGDGVALFDPTNAEVLLALHSHGPKLEGRALKEQISSFLGGCVAFLGLDGFATGLADVPDADGECSTFQYSLHTTNGN